MLKILGKNYFVFPITDEIFRIFKLFSDTCNGEILLTVIYFDHDNYLKCTDGRTTLTFNTNWLIVIKFYKTFLFGFSYCKDRTVIFDGRRQKGETISQVLQHST
jgi:hypothetical protein